MNVIITGATGMVGEGVLFECLSNEKVSRVLSISRKPYGMQHPKLKELLVPDFMRLDDFAGDIKGYDACFFCAGISSIGLNEERFTQITYDTTLAFAKSLIRANGNHNISFCYVSGSHTDSSEKGRVMWARVKGRTENALAALPFRSEYNFRPGAIQPLPGQKNWRQSFKIIVSIFKFFSPKRVLGLDEIGKAMINVVSSGYDKNILEIKDIRIAAGMKTVH